MTSGPVQQDLGTFDSLVATMRVLRDPKGGCPWDIEQTHRSLRHTLLEETYETLEALDSEEPGHIVEELGDLLLQVVFHAQIGQGNGTFTIQDVIRGINEKLHRRHPHVFGDAHVADSSEVKVQWDQIKAQERQDNGQGEHSALDGVPKSMPALAYAQATQNRASRAGFAWEGDAQVLAKVTEEIEELESAASREEQERELEQELEEERQVERPGKLNSNNDILVILILILITKILCFLDSMNKSQTTINRVVATV